MFNIFSFFTFWLYFTYCLAQELSFTHYTTENERNPLPSTEVNKIYQDKLGYIWFSLYSSGLIRYNGHSMELYTTEDGLLDLGVREITEDKNGKLCVGSDLGLVVSEKPLSSYFDGSRIKFTSKIHETELLKTTVRMNCLTIDVDNRIWVGTRGDGIIRYNISDSIVSVDTIGTDIYGEGKNITVYSSVSRRNGSVCVGINNGLLIFEKDSSKFKVLSKKEGLPQTARVLYEGHSETLYGGSADGSIWKLNEKDGNYQIETINTDFNTWIHSIMEIGQKTLWIASYGSGVMKLELPDMKKKTIYTPKNGFLSNNFYSIIQDREGNLWFSQEKGVSKLRANYEAFNHFTAKSHTGEIPILPASGVTSVIPPTESNFNIWVATIGGLSCINENGNVEVIKKENGIDSNTIYSTYMDKQERFWVGTTEGLNCLSKKIPIFQVPSILNKTSLFGQSLNINSFNFSGVYTSKAFQIPVDINSEKTVESIWFCGYRSVKCFVDDEFFNFVEESGLSATIFQSIALDNKGILWIGTNDRGLYRSIFPIFLSTLKNLQHRIDKGVRDIKSRVFENIWNKSVGAPSNNIKSLIWYDNKLWVGTMEGLFILPVGDGFASSEENPIKITTHLTKKDGLPGNYVTSMTLSPLSNTLWAGTNKGLAEIDTKSIKVIRTVTEDNGLLNNEAWFYESVSVGKDGTIYFGSAKGLSIYKPDLDKLNTFSPVLRLQYVNFTQDNSGNNELVIEYSGLSFVNERIVKYKTRLIGYDKDWSRETEETKIRYTNLPAFLWNKKYTFQMTASNSDGIWTETPLTYSFSVKPALWLRWWFLILIFVSLVLIIAQFGIRRVRQKAHGEFEERMKLEQIKTSERERIYKQVASDFHDQVSGEIGIINIFSELIKRKLDNTDSIDTKEYLKKISVSSNNLSNFKNSFLWILESEKVSLYDLCSHLKERGENIFDRTNINFRVINMQDSFRDITLPMEWKQNLVFIFIEGMNNTVKYSECKEVRLDVNFNDDRVLEMKLSDDGKGFSKERHIGRGTVNMQKRAEKIKCKLDVTSETGVGTVIHVIGKIPQMTY